MNTEPSINGSTPGTGSSTQELLLSSARKLFALKGFEGTTVKDVADEARVNISLVSYHFGGKEGLYRACLEQIGTDKLRRTRGLLSPAASLEEVRIKLTLFCTQIFEAHVEDPHLHAMMHRECEAPIPIIEDIFKRTFFKIWEELVAFITDAQKAQYLRADVDPQLATTQFMLSVLQLAKMDTQNFRFFGKTLRDPEYRTHATQQIVQLFLKGTAS